MLFLQNNNDILNLPYKMIMPHIHHQTFYLDLRNFDLICSDVVNLSTTLPLINSGGNNN